MERLDLSSQVLNFYLLLLQNLVRILHGPAV